MAAVTVCDSRGVLSSHANTGVALPSLFPALFTDASPTSHNRNFKVFYPEIWEILLKYFTYI
eukprot:1903869-Rhodomonas_salina.1